VRSPRAVSQTAPGRLRASYRPALGPVCEVLAALAPGMVLPFAPGNSRKRGPGLSQEVKALVSAAVERREASGPRRDRARARKRDQVATSDCVARPQDMRLPALRLPSFFAGGKVLRGVGKTRALSRAARTDRHCERSEAIQSEMPIWIASSLSAYALCAPADSYPA
jgi:hypothetical protein